MKAAGSDCGVGVDVPAWRWRESSRVVVVVIIAPASPALPTHQRRVTHALVASPSEAAASGDASGGDVAQSIRCDTAAFKGDDAAAGHGGCASVPFICHGHDRGVEGVG